MSGAVNDGACHAGRTGWTPVLAFAVTPALALASLPLAASVGRGNLIDWGRRLQQPWAGFGP